MSLSLLAGRTVDITRIVAEANKYKAGGGGGGGGVIWQKKMWTLCIRNKFSH